jgi:hypothetical protein
MSDSFNVRIPEGSDLTKILEKMLTELWTTGWLDSTSIHKIIDAGKIIISCITNKILDPFFILASVTIAKVRILSVLVLAS